MFITFNIIYNILMINFSLHSLKLLQQLYIFITEYLNLKLEKFFLYSEINSMFLHVFHFIKITIK